MATSTWTPKPATATELVALQALATSILTGTTKLAQPVWEQLYLANAELKGGPADEVLRNAVRRLRQVGYSDLSRDLAALARTARESA